MPGLSATALAAMGIGFPVRGAAIFVSAVTLVETLLPDREGEVTGFRLACRHRVLFPTGVKTAIQLVPFDREIALKLPLIPPRLPFPTCPTAIIAGHRPCT